MLKYYFNKSMSHYKIEHVIFLNFIDYMISTILCIDIDTH